MSFSFSDHTCPDHCGHLLPTGAVWHLWATVVHWTCCGVFVELAPPIEAWSFLSSPPGPEGDLLTCCTAPPSGAQSQFTFSYLSRIIPLILARLVKCGAVWESLTSFPPVFREFSSCFPRSPNSTSPVSLSEWWPLPHVFFPAIWVLSGAQGPCLPLPELT